MLLTVAEAGNYTQIQGFDTDLLTSCTARATVIFQNLSRPLEYALRTERHSGSLAKGRQRKLYLATYPVDPTASITIFEDGNLLSVSQDPLENPDVILIPDRGVLIRNNYSGWSPNIANVVVTYTAGYGDSGPATPADVVAALIEMSWLLYNARDHVGIDGSAGHGGGYTKFKDECSELTKMTINAYENYLRPRTLA